VKNLSVGQKKSLAEFSTNTAVAWFSAGIIAPFFISKKASDFIAFGIWGLIFTLTFLRVSLVFTKGVKS
jgi:hypothetical protein